VLTLPLIQDHRDSLLRPEKDPPPLPFVSLRDLELAGSTVAAQHNLTQHNPTHHNQTKPNQTQPNQSHNQTNLQANRFTISQNPLAASPFPTHLDVTQYQQTSHSFSTQNYSISSSPPVHHSNESLFTYSQGPFESPNPATTEEQSPNSSSLTAYRCTKCHRQYKHRRSQRRHFQVCHTKESQQTCPYCKGCFSRKDVLDAHLRNQHTWDQTMEARRQSQRHEYSHVTLDHGPVLR